MQILKNLKNPAYALLALGVTLVLFDLNYYLMANLPGERNLSCVVGAALTPNNIVFSLLTSVMTGLLVVGLIALYGARSRGTISFGAFGSALSVLTVFCTLCTLPVISLFGLSIGLGFLTTYSVAFQLLSFALLSGALFMLNRQLNGACNTCNID